MPFFSRIQVTDNALAAAIFASVEEIDTATAVTILSLITLPERYAAIVAEFAAILVEIGKTDTAGAKEVFAAVSEASVIMAGEILAEVTDNALAVALLEAIPGVPAMPGDNGGPGVPAIPEVREITGAERTGAILAAMTNTERANEIFAEIAKGDLVRVAEVLAAVADTSVTRAGEILAAMGDSARARAEAILTSMRARGKVALADAIADVFHSI